MPPVAFFCGERRGGKLKNRAARIPAWSCDEAIGLDTASD
jgi:hypothetical protein